MFKLKEETQNKYCELLEKTITPFEIAEKSKCLGINPNVISEINTTFDENSKGSYSGLVDHLNGIYKYTLVKHTEIYVLKINKGLPKTDAIQINLNGKPIGYYVPDKQEFYTSNWAWHLHYVNIVLPWIWPTILREINRGV